MPDFATLPLATVRPKVVRKTAAALRAEAERAQQSNLLETQAAAKPPAVKPEIIPDGYFWSSSKGALIRKMSSALARPTTTLLAVKPPPVVPKAPTLTMNIDDILAELNAPPTDAEKAETERENEEFQINEILDGIVKHEWTADETKDYIKDHEEMNLTAVLKRRSLHAILRFADGEDNFEEIEEIHRA
jgi:hypothetical protein